MEGFTLESLLLDVLDKLDPKQFSLPKKSTTQALVYHMHQIHAGLDKGQCSARVFFADFKKGFDLVDHNVIITHEFERLGVHTVTIYAGLNHS
jgi:phosphoribosyl 1,2-cyclic phosphodiesterase